MNEPTLPQSVLSAEGGAAGGTTERFLAGVCAAVYLQVHQLVEARGAVLTGEGAAGGVLAEVARQGGRVPPPAGALRTPERGRETCQGTYGFFFFFRHSHYIERVH